ncbi:DUF86 domain-containing protein [Cohnella sp. GCM10027633]|uniref:DUF86 domain-containing protein n=1 Tax=unclassified Cohnella TaxID=2636738 RepID=UPI00362511C8
MYDVNETLIQERLACLPELADALSGAARSWGGTVTEGLVQERALHLAAEIVTDVGHALIDGFIMRDASSYEDIVDIIAMENVIEERLAAPLRELVLLRKTLVQDFANWPRGELHRLTPGLPALLAEFTARVNDYLDRELRGQTSGNQ